MSSHHAPAPPPPLMSQPRSELYNALKRESLRILRMIHHERALKRVVSIYNQTQATITLTLSRQRTYSDDEDSNVVDAGLPAALRGLSTILTHSFRLNKFPPLKMQFWERVIKSILISQRESLNVDKMLFLLDAESYPEFNIDMNCDGPVDETLMGTIFEFLTTPPEHELEDKFVRQCEQFAPNKIRIGLVFEYMHYMVTPRSLRLVKQMLDRVYTSPTRQFAVSLLDLSNKDMSAAHLAVVVEILKKNDELYQIEHVRLSNATKRTERLSAPVRDKFQAVIAVASNSSLKSLNVGANELSVEHFAAFCSSLRYGCQLESINLTYTLDEMNATDREQCWRWLAYGIFYPRSKKLAADNKFRHIAMSHDPFEATDRAAFAKTLLDPAGELVYQGGQVNGRVKGELLICTIKQGSKFYTAPHIAQEFVYALEHEKELEALCQEGEWTCAVLPGVGFGWVANGQILNTECEVIDSSYRSGISVEWTFKNTSYRASSGAALHSLVEHVGSDLTSLILDEPRIESASMLPAILHQCGNLKHLCLRENKLCDHDIDLLIQALNGDLSDRLLSLDLSDNKITGVGLVKLCDFLSNSARTPALLELHVAGVKEVGSQAYASLRHALQVNKRLRMLEITDPTSYYDSDAEEEFDAAKVFERILVDFNGEMLPDFLPLNLKLAFLSIIQHVSSVGTARYHMDSFMVSTIFRFTAKTVRRRILWTDLYPPETPPDEYSDDGTPSYSDSEGQALDEFW